MDQHHIRTRAGDRDMNLSPVHGHDLSLRRIARFGFRFPQIRAPVGDNPQDTGRNRKDQDCRQHGSSKHGLSAALSIEDDLARAVGSSSTVTF